MTEARKSIASQIKKYRLACGMNQKQLAEALGVSKSAVSNWENGSNGVDTDLLPKLCNILHIEPNELLMTKNREAVSEEALRLSKAYDSLTPAGKELVQAAMEFAKKYHSASTAVRSIPVYEAALDGTAETKFARLQEVLEVDAQAEAALEEEPNK